MVGCFEGLNRKAFRSEGNILWRCALDLFCGGIWSERNSRTFEDRYNSFLIPFGLWFNKQLRVYQLHQTLLLFYDFQQLEDPYLLVCFLGKGPPSLGVRLFSFVLLNISVSYPKKSSIE